MKQTEHNVAWAIRKLSVLSGLDGFPRTEPGLRGIAMALLDIVCDQPDCYEDKYDTATGTGTRVKTREAMTAEQTVDWLLARVLASVERFPAPIVMRRLYETRFTASDGKLSGELEAK